MEENLNRHVERLKDAGDIRAKVAHALEVAIVEVVMKHDLGGVNGKMLIEAAQEAIAGNVSAPSEKVLTDVAEHAVEKRLAALGFDSAEILADTWVRVEEVLQSQKAE